MPENFWYSEKNVNKHCTEGAFANIIFHIGYPEEANDFQRLSVMSLDDLMATMAVDKFPSSVYTESTGIDQYEKCRWILNRKFSVKTVSIKPAHLNTPEKVYGFMKKDFSFSILLSTAGKAGSFHHIIGIWKDMIIDYECQYCLTLSIKNLNKICGDSTEFSHVIRGCAIFPSKRMKKSIGKSGDWGEHMVYAKEKDSLRNMFIFKKN